MKINIISFGDVNVDWHLSNIDDIQYLTREELSTRIRIPCIIKPEDIKEETISPTRKMITFPQASFTRVNPKTFNPFIRVMKDDEKLKYPPENLTIVQFSKRYKFIDIQEDSSCMGTVLSVFIDRNKSVGCLINHPVGVSGKLFSALAVFEDTNEIIKITVGFSRGTLVYTESKMNKKKHNFEMYRDPKTNKYRKQFIKVTYKRLCTAAYIIKGNKYMDMFSDLSKNDVLNYDKNVQCIRVPDGDPKRILAEMKKLKEAGYYSLTISDDIDMDKELINSKMMRYLFKTDKHGCITNIMSR